MYYRRLNAPVSVQIETTEFCDNRCIHCYNYWRNETRSRKKSYALSTEQLGFIADKLIRKQVFSVTLTGGEPLLQWRTLPPAIKKLRSSNVEVTLNSNLISLTKEIALALKDSGLSSILTSVLSCNEEIHDRISKRRGAWRRTVAGIKTAISTGLSVSANMVLLKDNFPSLYETAAFLKKLGVKSFSATKASPSLNSQDFINFSITKEQVRESLAVLEKIKQDLNLSVDILECYPLCLIREVSRFQHFARRSCAAGITTCTISAKGDVRPCSHADMVYGNLFRENLGDIWQRMGDWRRGAYIPVECHKCKFLSLCSGGCRMEAKVRGDIRGKDPYMTSSRDIVITTSAAATGKKTSFIKKTQILELVHGLSIREEEFGATVRTARGALVLVNKDGYIILNKLRQARQFSMYQVMRDETVKSESLYAFLTAMVKKGIIGKVKNQERR